LDLGKGEFSREELEAQRLISDLGQYPLERSVEYVVMVEGEQGQLVDWETTRRSGRRCPSEFYARRD
jgi:hypothetical protein